MARRALVVDDSISIRQMVSFTLAEAGFTVIEGCDGADALRKLESQAVELIITDLNMPVMDGLTFVRRARSRSETRYTPILILTTESRPQSRQEAKAAGATGWIVKPFHPGKLMEVVARVLP